MTVILPGEAGFVPGTVARYGNASDVRDTKILTGVSVRDYGENLVQPIPAVREAGEQCQVDCALQDATRAFDEFTDALTSRDAEIDKWPAQFAAKARGVRDRFAADVPDGAARDRFDAGFDLFAKAKAVETRALATHKRIAINRAELDRALAGYGDTISRAMNPVAIDFAVKQGEEAIRNQVAARVLSEGEGRELSRRYRTDIAARRAKQFMRDDPAGAALELEKSKGGLFAELGHSARRRFAAQARQAAEAQTLDAARLVETGERRMSLEKSLRRDAFLLDLDERAGKGEAALTDISAAARDGVLDADEAAARMEALENSFAERGVNAARVAELMKRPGTFLDPDDTDDRRAADIHWQDTVQPLVRNLPAPERTRLEDAVVLNTGIAPKPVVDGLLAGLLSVEPASRVAAARRVHRWLLAEPPFPIDRHGLRIPEFNTLRPYLDLPIPDARKVELAERDLARRETVSENTPPADGALPQRAEFGADTGSAAFSDGEAPARLEQALADPERRADLREQLLKDLDAEAKKSDLPPDEVLERRQNIRDALPADPSKETQIAFAPAVAAGVAIAPEAVASALAAIGLGGLVLSLKGDANENGNTTDNGIVERAEVGDGGDDPRGGRSDEDGHAEGRSAGDAGDDPPDRNARGRKTQDSSKNERHGDDGRALDKAMKKAKELESRLKEAPKKERKRIGKKLQRNRREGARKRRGTEHSRRGKRGNR